MLIRHAKEFANLFRKHKYERSPQGVYFPSAHITVSGLYSVRTNDGPWEDSPNLLPTEGLNTLLNNLIANTGVPLYLSLYKDNIAPAAGWTGGTGTNYVSTANEITSGSEGYTQATRVLWNAAAASAATKDNYASVAVFTIITGTTLPVWGVGLHKVSTKGDTTAFSLVSATQFNAVRTFVNTDEFDVKYRLAMTSS